MIRMNSCAMPLHDIILMLLLSLSCLSCSFGRRQENAAAQEERKVVKQYRTEIVAEYPHDAKSYTQGLFFKDGELIETTGQYGESTLRRVDVRTGESLTKLNFDGKYFAEGSVALNGKIYVLTWQNEVVFVYDAETFRYVSSHTYPREGWGLTTDGKQLIASDGSNRLYFMDEDLRINKTLKVTLNGHPVKLLNELEWIDGKIWANVYTSDVIVMIDPQTGNVEGVIDCQGLLSEELRDTDTDVLNGIAHEPLSGRIFLTGKNWKRLYEVRIVEKKNS